MMCVNGIHKKKYVRNFQQTFEIYLLNITFNLYKILRVLKCMTNLYLFYIMFTLHLNAQCLHNADKQVCSMRCITQ